MGPQVGNNGGIYSFGYRADGLRVWQVKQNGVQVETHYLYDGQMPVLEQDYEDGVLKQTRVNFLGARGIEAIITVDHTRNDQASLQWLFYDGHGNVVRLMFPHPLPLSRSFGRGVWRSRRGEGSCANLGHPEDETGLVYMRARYYEPWTGRFLSEDPSRDGVNWYLYADGNPVNKVDADGCYNLMDIIFLIYQLGIPAIFVGYIFTYNQDIFIKSKIEIVNELAADIERRMPGMTREAFESAIDDLLKMFRYIKDLEKEAMSISKARGRIADIAILYVVGEAIIIALEITLGEWL